MTEVFPHLASPLWLLLLAIVPLLAWRHHRRPGLGALSYSRLPEAGAVRGAGDAGRRRPRRSLRSRAWRLHLPFYARLLALACVAVALARPQLGYSWEESLTEGMDIEIVLDVSGSMGAEDFQPKNRLEVAKKVVKDFVAGRTGDRIGMVMFAGGAVTRAPVTTDHAMLNAMIDAVALNTLPDGTAIGVALANAASRLKDSPAKSRVIVLVTDGVNNAGAIDPASAAAVCQGLGIKVYTVGVGTTGMVPFPTLVEDSFGRRSVRHQLVSVSLDEPLLRAIAARTGGRYFRATDRDSLARIFDDIDRLEKTQMRVKRYVRYREAFQPFAWAGFALLLLPLAAAGARATAEP
jgi:Ca-activated chloride channel family protein